MYCILKSDLNKREVIRLFLVICHDSSIPFFQIFVHVEIQTGGLFANPPSPPSCPRSCWMTPYVQRKPSMILFLLQNSGPSPTNITYKKANKGRSYQVRQKLDCSLEVCRNLKKFHKGHQYKGKQRTQLLFSTLLCPPQPWSLRKTSQRPSRRLSFINQLSEQKV